MRTNEESGLWAREYGRTGPQPVSYTHLFDQPAVYTLLDYFIEGFLKEIALLPFSCSGLAAVSYTHLPLPGMETLEPFNIIYQTAEDGLGDTVKPRLMEADAAIERVLVIDDIHVHIVLNSLRIYEVPLLPYMDRPADTREGCKHRCTNAAMEYFKSEVMEMCHREGLYRCV